MLWRRRRLIWTDPLPAVSQYVNVLGSKLKFLFRAPTGVTGNNLLASAWTDSITGMRIPRTAGTPTLGPVASLFGGKDVVQIPAAGFGRFSGSFKNPVIASGESPELFIVFRANSLPGFCNIVEVINPATGLPAFGIDGGLNQLQLDINNANTSIAFADTTNAHFFSGRRDPSTGTAVFNVDGVDTVGSSVSVVNSTCVRFDISGSFPFDGTLALCGLVQSAMSDAERADILRIARAEYAF